ncbi:hypothetical protein CW304_04600 [Bacillus sp. UFRGS-B20]|nr:hypothetical protein CW304_04600 [Bacillus sp. UFRGS-B20]
MRRKCCAFYQARFPPNSPHVLTTICFGLSLNSSPLPTCARIPRLFCHDKNVKDIRQCIRFTDSIAITFTIIYTIIDTCLQYFLLFLSCISHTLN